MNPDCCITTKADPGVAKREEELEAWQRIEATAMSELRSAQQRLDAVRGLRRLWESHGHPAQLLDAAEGILDLYPAS